MFQDRTIAITRKQVGYAIFGLATSIALSFATPAAAAQPAVKNVTGVPISPATANTYYGSGTTHTKQGCTLFPTLLCDRPTAIRELARTLSRGGTLTADQFTTNAFEYVYKNVDTEFRYGLSKGAFGALLDQSGTPFDQANLMVELLRQGAATYSAYSSLTATYYAGTVTLDGTEFSGWTGISNAAAACQLLTNGGIPAAVNGSTPASCTTLTGNVSSVVMSHIWVSTGGKLYDPSYKSYVQKAGIDVAAAMGCGSDASPSCGASAKTAAIPAGGTYQGYDSAAHANYVQNVQMSSLVSTINGYATNLQHYVETNLPTAKVEDIVGGREINFAAMPTPGATLSYDSAPTVQHTWTGDIPDQYRSRLNVQFDNINIWLFADETYGNWLEIGGIYTGTNFTTRNADLILEREKGNGAPASMNYYLPASETYKASNEFIRLVSSSKVISSDNATLTLAVDHPYAAQSGAYADESFSSTIKFGYWAPGQVYNVDVPFFIFQSWGKLGRGFVDRMSHMGADKQEMIANGDGRTLYNTSMPGQFAHAPTNVMVPSVTASWMAQANMASGIADAVASTRTEPQHMVGYIIAEGNIDTNVVGSLSVTSKTADATAQKSSFVTTATAFDAYEGGAIEQAFDHPDGGNSLRWFELTNATSNRFFEATPTNITNIWSNIVSGSYSGDGLHNNPQSVINGYLATGNNPQFNMVMPKNGHVGQYTDGTYTLTYNYGPLFAYSTDTGSTQIAYLTSDGYKGGGEDALTVDPVADALKNGQNTGDQKALAYNADLASGRITASAAPDLVTGAGKFPESLAFQRFYDSSQNTPADCKFQAAAPANYLWLCGNPRDRRMMNGWSDNFQIDAAFANDGMRALGVDAGVEASTAIAALYTIRDLNKTTSFQNYVTTIFAGAWLQDSTGSNAVVVHRPPSTDTFVRLPDGRFNPRPGSNKKVVQSGTRVMGLEHGSWRFGYAGITLTETDGDGATLAFSVNDQFADGDIGAMRNKFKVDNWTFPSGEKLVFAYHTTFDFSYNQTSGPYHNVYIMDYVQNSQGRRLSFAMNYGGVPSDPDGFVGPGFTVTDETSHTVELRSLPASEDLSPLTGTMAPNSANGLAFKIIGVDGNKTFYANDNIDNVGGVDSLRLSRVYLPLAPTAAYETFTFDGLRRVATAVDANTQTTTFYPARVTAELNAKGSVVDALGNTSEQYFDDMGRLLQSKDPLGRVTTLAYDGLGRLSTKTMPEGDYATYTYDVRSNLLSTVSHPKPGSAEATAGQTITASTTYGEGPTILVCSNPKICNKPLTSTNGNGKVTNYTFNGTTGLLTQVLLPADPSGTRPQTNYGYTATTIGSDSVNLLTSKTEKINASTSTVTAYTYNASNKYVLQTSVVDSGSGHLALTSTYTFDTLGNLTQIDGPRTDVTDVQNFTWDSKRRPIFSIGVDPDGAGAKKRVATKNTYNLNGWVTQVDTGTTTSATGSDFVSSLAATNSYDAMGHKTKTATPTAVTQYSYDADERLQCTAARMNPAVFGSLPVACTLGTAGSYGNDRITKLIYDAAGQVTTDQRAVGVSGLAQNYAVYTYTNNGKQASVYDALGTTHKTQYAYDGFDRLKTTTFPGSTTEALTYDNDSNVLTRKNRAGQTLTYTYDNLDRLRTKAVPAVGSIPANTVTWTYDLVSEPTSITDTLGNMLTDVFDLAKRKTSSARVAPSLTGTQTLTYKYDQSGNRTSLVWPDNYCVNYQFDAAGRLTWATEGTYAASACTASTTLATYDYDTLGRRAYVQYGNNAKQSYTWSTEGDLNSLAQDFNGTANDVSFTDTFNPAHQLATATITNPLFKFVVGASGTDSYGAVNALNQYPTVTPAGSGAQTIAYDNNGNLTGDGTWTFVYDPENRLMTANKTGTAVAYAYDPLGRRTKKTVNSASTFFLQDGDDEVGEYTAAGAIQRRFVPGDTIDEPISMIDYTIAGNPKTYFHTDKQGSTIAMTDASGNLAEGPYKYDGYGNGAPTTGVPFKFTGRRLDPETGLYYYRARYYSASLGRFLQTDPVDYDNDLNLYAYVGNDPVNVFDPMGEAYCDQNFNCYPSETETVTVTATAESSNWWSATAAAIPAAAPSISLPAFPELAGLVADVVPPAIVACGLLCATPAGENCNADNSQLGCAGHVLTNDKNSDKNAKTKAQKATSKVWKKLKPFRGQTKTNGDKGKGRRYYEWDHTHGAIEEYDSKGKHLGEIDPESGDTIPNTKVPGRYIDL